MTSTSRKRTLYEVIVGNVGTVYSGNNKAIAKQTFATYVEQSKTDSGRACGESVTFLTHGEITREYVGTLELPEAGR